MIDLEIYPYSLSYAKRIGPSELKIYKESMSTNIACRDAIVHAINNNYDGHSLKVNVAKVAIKQFGYDRVQYILATSILHKSYDGRISDENKQWANKVSISADYVGGRDRRRDFTIDKDGLLDIVTNQFRKAYKELNLWDIGEVTPTDGLNFENKLMVIDPKLLNHDYKTREHQLFFCSVGTGCDPLQPNKKIYGEFLMSGDQMEYYREHFVGEAKTQFLSPLIKEKYVIRLMYQEAKRILREFKRLQEPNSPDQKYFVVRISPFVSEFNGYSQILNAMPFDSFNFISTTGEPTRYCIIEKNEDRTKELKINQK